MNIVKKIYREFLLDQSGNVESALVVIPLMFLFLSILQIAASAMARSSDFNLVQGSTSRIALLNSNSGTQFSPTLPGGASLQGSALDESTIPLTGGGSIIVARKMSSLPILTPLLINRDRFISTGIAVDENP